MIPNEKIKSIYLIAICGTGMASLAGLLQKSGYQVTGSDSNIYPPMSTLLQSSGIDIKPGYQRKNITNNIEKTINESLKRHKDNNIAIIPEGPYVIPTT